MTLYTIRHIYCAFSICCAASLVTIPCAGAAQTPFEIDLKELEPTAPTAKPSRKPASRPTRKPSGDDRKIEPSAEKDGDGDVVRYTIKPGDFLFKILIRDFGLSNTEAEARIPHILKLNNISNIRKLDVGQTILIPTGKHAKITQPTTSRAAAATRQAVPAAKPVPATAAPTAKTPSQTASVQEVPPAEKITASTMQVKTTPPPQPATLQTPPTPTTAPSADALSVGALVQAWEQLVPGEEHAESIKLDGYPLDSSRYLLLPAADGGRILVDLHNSLPPGAKSLLAQKYPDVRLITRGKESLTQFISSLVRAAEFARVEENTDLDFGTDPKLTVHTDFRVLRLPTAARGPETVLFNVTPNGPCLPASVKDFLSRNGFIVAEYCPATADPFADSGFDFRTITDTAPCGMVDSLLDVLSIKLDRNRIISGSLGSNMDGRFSVRVEGYFEADGKRYILNCGENDSYNYTLFRLLGLEGYTILLPGEKDDFQAVASMTLSALKLPYNFGKHEFNYDHYSISLTGFKVSRRNNSSGRLLISNKTTMPAIVELLKWNPKVK